MKDEMIEKMTTMIGHAGEAKSLYMEAIKEAKNGCFDLAEEKIQEAKGEYLVAHRVHADLLQRYARGEEVETDFLQVHAQNHLLSAEMAGYFAKEIVDLWKERENL